MKSTLYTLLLAVTMLLSACSADTSVTSPDGRLTFNLVERNGELCYTFSRDNQPVIDTSRLGLVLREADLSQGLEIGSTGRASKDETWQQPWGEEIDVRNRYNELTVALRTAGGRRMNLVARLFDDGLGFRYEIPAQEGLEKITVMDELTEFNVAADAASWSIPSNHTAYYEGIYREMPLSKMDTVCTPLTMRCAENLYMTIHEAALTDYAKMNLTPVAATSRLKADLTPWSTGEKVFAEGSLTTPWRTVIVADKAGDLVLSRLMLNLNEPCAIEDTSWIEPGRYIGIWWAIHMEDYSWSQGPKHGATTENTKRYIDFAAENGFSAVLAEGWNRGWDGNWTLDGAFSYTEAYPDFDLEEVTRYAAERGVRFIGHCETGGDTRTFERDMEEAFALYNSLGINSIKTGYVRPMLDSRERHDSQYGVRHYRRVIEAAARHKIMVDNHEPVMPTGLQRTYPNLMTQEGVRGQEYNAWSADGGNPPSHTVTLPFTRGLAGPMDYTPNVFNHENNIKPGTQPGTTVAAELAMNVLLFSPLQMAADKIENYVDNPAMEFVTACPTTWAATVVPEAEIGRYATFARRERDGDRWFLGAATVEPRTTAISLDFLDAGACYTARIFADGEGAHCHENPSPLTISDREVDASMTLEIPLAYGGGCAVIFTKM